MILQVFIGGDSWQRMFNLLSGEGFKSVLISGICEKGQRPFCRRLCRL